MEVIQEWYRQEAKDSEEDMTHSRTFEENNFYYAVASGDIEAVRENCRQQRFADPEGTGILSRDPLINIKYHFVVAVALIARHCSESGMETEQAYRLSDFYIMKLDNLYTIQEVAKLHSTMVLDYTEKMRILKKNKGTSKAVTKCIDYIYVHIKDRITIDDLADHTRLSTSHLSRLFKKEVGISVSDYIREQKIEKAKNLLRYSDYSLIDIANYLSFSSQSHFIQVFSKHVGKTPKKYRDRYYFTSWDTNTEKKMDAVEK